MITSDSYTTTVYRNGSQKKREGELEKKRTAVALERHPHVMGVKIAIEPIYALNSLGVSIYSLNPLGLFVCQRHASAHASSMLYLASHLSSVLARTGSTMYGASSLGCGSEEVGAEPQRHAETYTDSETQRQRSTQRLKDKDRRRERDREAVAETVTERRDRETETETEKQKQKQRRKQ